MKWLFSTRIWNVDLAALILRVVFAVYMMAAHGYGKFERWDEISNDFATPFGMPVIVAAAFTVLAEFICALLIIPGLFTRLATIPIIIVMAVAAFKIHGDDPFVEREGAITYLAAFIVVFILGPGKYSLDSVLSEWKRT